MLSKRLLCLGTFSLAAACSSDEPQLATSSDGGAANDARASLDAVGGTDAGAALDARTNRDGPAIDGPVPIPEACQVSTTRQAPFPVTIHFQNMGTKQVFVRNDCAGLSYGISSCAGAFRDQLRSEIGCACSCDSPSCRGGLACGACPDPSGAAVPPQGEVVVTWDALRVTTEQRAGFSCVRTTALPAARYRLSIDVYDSALEAAQMQAGRSITADFALPADGDQLNIDISGVPSVCDAAPSSQAPLCEVGSNRDVPCNLASSLIWRYEGGNSPIRDASAVTPPNTYKRTRMFLQGNRPTLECQVALPRCSRDARVATTSDLARALADADVQAAFAAGGMIVYGNDSRPTDGAVLLVQLGTATFAIGGACTPAPGNSLCARARPAGLEALGALLGRIDQQQMTDAACSALKP